MTSLGRLSRAFAGDRKGAAAIEFAIVVVPFLSMVGFLFQMSLMFFWTQSVEMATIQAARAIRSGNVQSLALTADQFKTQKLCTGFAPGMMCADAIVQVRGVAKTWSATRTSGVYSFIDLYGPSLLPPQLKQADAKFCPGASGELVYVDVVYEAPRIFSWVWPDSETVTVNGEKKLLIRATTMVMNEPFTGKAGLSC